MDAQKKTDHIKEGDKEAAVASCNLFAALMLLLLDSWLVVGRGAGWSGDIKRGSDFILLLLFSHLFLVDEMLLHYLKIFSGLSEKGSLSQFLVYKSSTMVLCKP